MDYIKVSSVAEYFKYIEEYALINHISRGESRKFKSIISGAFRPYKRYKMHFGEKHTDEFYNYVANELTSMQKEHFLAFAQHSGLPTYLIDFTTSHLVSLFFACNDDNSNTDEPGYVYFINKRRMVNLDEHMLNGYSGGLLERIKDCENGIIDVWANKFDADVTKNYFDYDASAFLNDYQLMINSFLDFITHQEDDFSRTELYQQIRMLCEELQKAKLINSEQSDYRLYFDNSSFDAFNVRILALAQKILPLLDGSSIIEDLIRRDSVEEKLMSEMYAIQDYGLLRWRTDEPYERYETGDPYPITWQNLVLLLMKIATQFAIYSTKTDFYLPFYGSYSPPNISGRISQQSSVFLCQIHQIETRHRNERNPRNILLTQEIRPDFMLEVANKRKILNELDMLGINLKTIFGDHDNIAKYIRNSFFNGIDEPER